MFHKKLQNIPCGKKTQSLVYYKDKILIIGGGDHSSSHESQVSYEYNLTTKKFKRILSLNIRRYYHTSIIYQGYLYVYGGFQGVFWDFTIKNIFNLDLENEYKKKLLFSKNIPPPRGQHTANVYNDKMIIFGGALQNRLSNELWEFGFKSREWKMIKSENETKPRRAHGSVIFNDKLYVFGGVLTDDDDLIYSNPSCFDFKTLKWREITDCTYFAAGIGSSTVLWNNSILFFGGFHGIEMNNLVIFDLNSELIKVNKIEYILGRSWGSGCLGEGNSFYYVGGEFEEDENNEEEWVTYNDFYEFRLPILPFVQNFEIFSDLEFLFIN
eukprot:gene9705-1910_t